MQKKIEQYNNLVLRVIAGIIGVSVICSAILLGRWTYSIVFLIIGVLALREFYGLVTTDEQQPQKKFGIFLGIFFYSISFGIEAFLLSNSYYYVFLGAIPIVFIVELFRKSSTYAFHNIGFTCLGILYIILPLTLLHNVAFIEGKYSFEVVLGSLLLLWANDTGAYFSGKLLGKHKLFERVSPKKTWEGSIGGAVLALTIALFCYHYLGVLLLWQWLVLAFIIVIAGTLGDLVESLFKRGLQVKDSASSIPGHGGFLDRFDGLFIALPFINLFLEFIFQKI